MTSGHDEDLFGVEVDYEKYWRDQYHEACRDYGNLMTFDDGWIVRLCAENNHLQRQLRRAERELAELKKTCPRLEALSAHTPSLIGPSEHRATESRDQQTAPTSSTTGGSSTAAQPSLQQSNTPQALADPFGRKK
ncbi:hypothetical protein BST61_g2662 [Cercospora zeina]